MDNQALLDALLDAGYEPAGDAGTWELAVDGVHLYVIADQDVDRMRIISPIEQADSKPLAYWKTLLSANFDRALDAKYALYKGVIWATFLHPMSSLTDELLADAIRQVVTLVRNTGTSFASSDLVFGGDESDGLN